MRIAIDLDDAVIAEALFATGLPSVEAMIEESLRDLIAKHRDRKPTINLAGFGWSDKLGSMSRKQSSDERL